MALTKEITQDKIEVVSASKHLQVRTKTAIMEDGVELSSSFHRHIVSCVSSAKNEDNTWTHTDTNISAESAEVQAIAAAVWTDAVKAAVRTANENA
jgi:predicted Zn-dependent protease